MRVTSLVPGFKNSQKIRFIVDGFAMYCTIKDVSNIASHSAQNAVWSALKQLADMRSGSGAAEQCAVGLGTTINRHQVQVDLCS
jgi:O-methyltransferase involved in polyketide biosynthesis